MTQVTILVPIFLGVSSESTTRHTLYEELLTVLRQLRIDEAVSVVVWAVDQRTSLEQTIASALSHPDSSATLSPASPLPAELTPREVEVLRLLAVGKSNQQIAAELALSIRTAERHIANIYEKIGANGKTARAAATAFAFSHSLIPH